MKVSTKPKCPTAMRKVIKAVADDFNVAIATVFAGDTLGMGNYYAFFEAMKAIKTRWGFKRKQTNSVNNAVFISKKHGVVIKLPYMCEETEQKPASAIYTKVIRISRSEDYDASEVFIQPLADRSNMAKVYEAFRSINAFLHGVKTFAGYNDDHGIISDQHHNNVGIFMGEAVSIDW